MKKFRVKPIEIEAERYHFIGNPNPHPAVRQMLVTKDGVPTMQNVVQTPIGPVVIHEGDWVLKYPDGSLHAMDHDSFEENYEPI